MTLAHVGQSVLRYPPRVEGDRCPFCAPPDDRILDTSDLAFSLRDGYPVSPGHTLCIPRRHVADWFEATDEERADLMSLVSRARDRLQREIRPDGFNIGINCGRAAGQTVFHLHVHLIPRFEGDVPDPRGGVRWVKPDQARYWE